MNKLDYLAQIYIKNMTSSLDFQILIGFDIQPNDKVHLTIGNETFNAMLIGKTDKKLMFERLKCDWSRFRFGGKLYKIDMEDLTSNKVTIKKHEI